MAGIKLTLVSVALLTSEVNNQALVCINYNLSRQVSSIPNLEWCVHCVVAPSFENGEDVWFVHLRGKFANLNISKISLNICRQMAFFLDGSHTNITIRYYGKMGRFGKFNLANISNFTVYGKDTSCFLKLWGVTGGGKSIKPLKSIMYISTQASF